MHTPSCLFLVQTHGGITYLRYDDTDPEKEEERFIRGIQEMVEWLGGEGGGGGRGDIPSLVAAWAPAS